MQILRSRVECTKTPYFLADFCGRNPCECVGASHRASRNCLLLPSAGKSKKRTQKCQPNCNNLENNSQACHTSTGKRCTVWRKSIQGTSQGVSACTFLRGSQSFSGSFQVAICYLPHLLSHFSAGRLCAEHCYCFSYTFVAFNFINYFHMRKFWLKFLVK